MIRTQIITMAVEFGYDDADDPDPTWPSDWDWSGAFDLAGDVAIVAAAQPTDGDLVVATGIIAARRPPPRDECPSIAVPYGSKGVMVETRTGWLNVMFTDPTLDLGRWPDGVISADRMGG